ncbi:hypothetical protein JCM12294_01630 [Desulfocicer niacini]
MAEVMIFGATINIATIKIKPDIAKNVIWRRNADPTAEDKRCFITQIHPITNTIKIIIGVDFDKSGNISGTANRPNSVPATVSNPSSHKVDLTSTPAVKPAAIPIACLPAK